MRSLIRLSGAAALVLWLSAPALASPILYASTQTLTPLVVTQITSGVDPVSIDTAAADARADFGSTGVALNSAESLATAAWLDEWTITGSTGTGTLTVTWELEGTISLANGLCTGCLADPGNVFLRSLYGASTPTSAGTVLYQLSSTSAIVNTSGSFDFTFTYGQTFTAGFRLNGSLADDFYGGTFDFLNSATLTSVILPAGATLTASSGTDYAVATAPEPTSTLLLAVAVLGAGVRRRRQRRE